MSVKIRLSRVGKKNQPKYRIVVTDSQAKRDGRHIEVVGFYDPLKEPAEIKLKKKRIEYWLEKGAQMSDTVRNLFRKSNN